MKKLADHFSVVFGRVFVYVFMKSSFLVVLPYKMLWEKKTLQALIKGMRPMM